MDRTAGQVLSINTGSSSLKAALFDFAARFPRHITARVERIGMPGSRVTITDTQGAILYGQAQAMPDHDTALHMIVDWLHGQQRDAGLRAIGHRVVHGGPRYSAPS